MPGEGCCATALYGSESGGAVRSKAEVMRMKFCRSAESRKPAAKDAGGKVARVLRRGRSAAIVSALLEAIRIFPRMETRRGKRPSSSMKVLGAAPAGFHVAPSCCVVLGCEI